MKTLSTLVIQAAMASLLLSAISGCSATADAHSDVARAHARVTAADAHVKVAEADARADALANPRREKQSRAKAVIPSGTLLKIFLIDAIDSGTSSQGDRFLASLAESVVVNGATLLPKGTRVRGRVINADGAGQVRNGVIHLDLIDIVRGNRAVTISTGIYEANEIHYDPETRLDFTLTSAVDL